MALYYSDLGVSENRGPQYSTLNSRILIIRSPGLVALMLNWGLQVPEFWFFSSSNHIVTLTDRSAWSTSSRIQGMFDSLYP